MGWFPTVLENTLEKALTEDFYKDLFDYCLAAAKDNNWTSIPDAFSMFRWGDENISFEDFMDDLPYMAFCDDHMEHIGNWLYWESVWPIFKKHRVNGRYVLSHENGDGGYNGIEFVNGEPYNVEVEIVQAFNRGKKLS